MTSFYLAARYSRQAEMSLVADLLRAKGSAVTSRWLEEDEPEETQFLEGPDRWYLQTAQNDLVDILRSDTLVFFAEDPRVGVPRGGRHFECGFAYASGKRIVVVGGKENIFHYLPDITHYSSLDEFIEREVR